MWTCLVKSVKSPCYVDDEHLLAFTHDGVPISGVQVPAGSIRTSESPEEAAIRELF
ncbi:NUDIX domain-containing protein [Arthrobacter sunyaminii]|uniref:NUDIX domain-containing protein n=1 Tax=Arthrobacter sunyaminii TaxID=2816859 RepID=UPI003557E233